MTPMDFLKFHQELIRLKFVVYSSVFKILLSFSVKWRFIIAAMICLTCMINFIVRGNMSINILAMTKPLYNTTDAVPDVKFFAQL